MKVVPNLDQIAKEVKSIVCICGEVKQGGLPFCVSCYSSCSDVLMDALSSQKPEEFVIGYIAARVAFINAGFQKRAIPTTKENIITQALNAIIQIEMEERNLSRADMARRLEISPVTVTKSLNNKQRDWRITTLSNWADAMNCDLHIEFRARSDEPEPR